MITLNVKPKTRAGTSQARCPYRKTDTGQDARLTRRRGRPRYEFSRPSSPPLSLFPPVNSFPVPASHLRESASSAGNAFQSAVFERLAECNSAIRQITNLRYELAVPFPFPQAIFRLRYLRLLLFSPPFFRHPCYPRSVVILFRIPPHRECCNHAMIAPY